MVSPHGIPKDLLDRLLIVRTKPYAADEILQIIRIRAQTEGIQVEPAALQQLTAIAERASLRLVAMATKGPGMPGPFAPSSNEPLKLKNFSYFRIICYHYK